MSSAFTPGFLPRCRPDPVPAIYPLPEYLAEGSRKADYEDTKAILQVPWMGVVTMSFSHYRHFYKALWGGLRPLFQSAELAERCVALRLKAEGLVAGLAPPSIIERLKATGYAPREIDAICDINTVFHIGNLPYVLMATYARLLLEGHELSTVTATMPFAGRHAPPSLAPFVLMEAHHADQPTRAIYDDVKAQPGLPLVNTDYRAFARWPSYFATAWQDLRSHLQTPGYEAIVRAMHEAVVQAALSLPNPGGLTSAILRDAARQEGSFDEVHRTVQLFQWLLPGLIINVAYFRAQL